MQAPARKLTPTGYFADVQPTALYVVPAQTSGNVSLTPASATLTITPTTPSISAGGNYSLAPAAAALALTGATPSITATNHITVTPAAASVDLTGSTPTISAGGNVAVSPAPASLALVGATSTIAVTANQTLAPAAAALSIAGQTPTITAGASISLSPAAASIVLAGGTATVTFTVTVPDVVGDTQSAATATLEGEGFTVRVLRAYSDTIPAGEVISQSPTAGNEIPEGSQVTITVSRGVYVPGSNGFMGETDFIDWIQ
jgi:hypothetical protein